MTGITLMENAPDILGRTGGPFLDQLELIQREAESAVAEEREPDFSLENIAPLMTDANLILGVAATADFNRIDVNMNSIEDVDAVIARLVSRKAELEGTSTTPETAEVDYF